MRRMRDPVCNKHGLPGDAAGISGFMADHKNRGGVFCGDFGHQIKHFSFQRRAKGGKGFIQQQKRAGAQ